MKTTAAVSRAPREPFTIEEVDLPDPGPDQVLVRIVGVGLCHTDLASRDGLLTAPFPAIFGHEGSGVVEAVGAGVTKVAPGDAVVLAPMSDGTCPECQTGQPMYCDQFTPLNFQTDSDNAVAALTSGGHAHIEFFGQSSFARHALAHERNTIKVRADAPLEILGPLGCGIQTGAGTVMNGLKPEAGSSIVILGTGAVGLAALLGAVVCGCATVIAVDRIAAKLELAKSLGATHGIDTSDGTDVGEAIRRVLPRGADFIVDSAGVPALIAQAVNGMSQRGTLALVAVPPAADRKLELPWLQMLLAGQKVQGFIEGDSVPDIFIPRMIELNRQGRFPFERLISTYPFERINDAVTDLHDGKIIKAVMQVADQ